ncbi:methyltransferase domain-containing protein [Streptacidiphilus sp. P02-A3a]|uniref:methyltransferase domain-containing protein n=1 Tax=Streptacidiphilus sp. P02-A3a TaxID=2704468 RepID=UPI0015F9077C|nr:methyltransferase domain-containing protein [Streptacidiphilus sp. P02-A3a]QMU71867.1 methyltransferase, FxLD system [Streptacidiphilus sp. P02-A3a]
MSALDTAGNDLNSPFLDAIRSVRPDLPQYLEDAIRAVPRHAYLPGADLDDASDPTLVPGLLQQLDVTPGDTILEIGAGTGYSAALLSTLSGGGKVVTVGIDREMSDRAAGNLAANGVANVEVLTAGDSCGDPKERVFDRLISTVGAWDVLSAWWRQVRPGGWMVLPLRLRGTTCTVALEHCGTDLVSSGAEPCGPVPVMGETGERSADIDPWGRARLYWDVDQDVDPVALLGVLDSEPIRTDTGVTTGPEAFDRVWLRLAATDPATCRIEVTPEGVEAGLAGPAVPVRTACLAEGSSVAYLTFRRRDAEAPTGELGVAAHGPDAAALTQRLTAVIAAWGKDRTNIPEFTVYPATTPLAELPPGNVITKRDSHVIITY